MKLGVAYIVFDGIELLEHSILPIRQHCDYISIIYQNVSWFGKKADPDDLKKINSLKTKGLIDDIFIFNDFSPLKSSSRSSIQIAKKYELLKRQFGLLKCLEAKCTHYLCMDVDEFYESNEFLNAKNKIIKFGYTATAVRFINYVKTPTLHRGFDPNRVPFICKISHTTTLSNNFFVKCDPTRGINNGYNKNYEFSHSEIKMHHMETVRKNLNLKYESTTRMIFQRDRMSELINKIKSVNEKTKNFNFNKIIFPGIKSVSLTSCENIFNIPFTSWQ
jgi:hypothetical protein